MQIALVDGDSVLEVGDHRQVFPNTSFTYDGPDDDFLADNNAMKVKLDISFDPDTEKLAPCEPFIDGDFVITTEVVALTQAELDARAEQKATDHRLTRNRLLADCDWTQLSDAPVDKALWATYRQELRDVTAQPDFPWAVNWPVSPAEAS